VTDPRLPALSSNLRTLLANERLAQPADAALRQRVLERARAAIEERPSGVGLRVAGLAWRRGRAPRTILLVAAAVAAAGLAAAGANFYRLGRTPASSFVTAMPPAATPVEARPARAAPLPLAVPSANASATQAETEPFEAPRAPATTTPSEPTRPPSASTFALELSLLEPARRSIAHGDFAGALAAIARHQREYPRGQLAEEREALRVRAIWGMGDKAAAERVATSFRKRYPHSGLLSWMKPATTSQ
jgi:hypothetical protein